MLTLAPQYLASGGILSHAKHRDQVVTMLNTSTMSLPDQDKIKTHEECPTQPMFIKLLQQHDTVLLFCKIQVLLYNGTYEHDQASRLTTDTV